LKSLLRVLGYIRPYWGWAALTFVAASAAAAIELLPPWLLKLVIDDVIGQNQIELLPWLIGGLLLAYAGKNLAASLRIRFNNTLEQQVVYDLRSDVFAALQRLSISYFENRSTGEIMSRINNDVEHVERIFIDGIEALLMSTLTLIGISVILFSLNWRLALLSLLPIPVLIYSASYFTRKVHGFYRMVREETAELNAYLQDVVSGIREILGFNREAYEQSRFNQRSKAYSDSNLRVMRLWSMYSPSMIFVGSLGSVIILWYGTREVLRGSMTCGCRKRAGL
jgi:ATP-binding cassette subfamily B protein/subfamily B ATP-binding cassette protein MsbA